jgi:acyl-coenzyme A thioesterase PaaI-like protein
VNFLSPAKGERFIARGKVVKLGQTIIVTSGEVFSLNENTQKLVALMTATMMVLQDRPGVAPG